MQAPLFSTITLVTEIFVTLSVLTIVYKSIKTSIFPKKLAFLTLAYEIIFNISYMVYSSVLREAHERKAFTWKTGLAIFHGILSLVMFLSLIIFLIIAYKAYQKKINYFVKHKVVTGLFLFFWLAAVFSGGFLYIAEYWMK